MAEKTLTGNLLATVTEALNEEKWTRATLNNYTVHNFEELDQMLEQIFTSGLEDEVNEACAEHLQHSRNSIIALYLSGVIHLRRQVVDDANLITLISIFTDNRKWGIVEFLAERILQFGANKVALRTLADCYSSENQSEKLTGVWEQLIRVDFEEADIVRHLADQKEQEGNVEEAVDYYKKALHRYINKKNFNAVKEVWHRLIQYAPEDTEFFYHAEGKIAKSLSEDRAVQLLEDLYPHFKKQANWNRAIDILKRILNYDSKNPWARKEITECYRELYSGHSQLDEFIKVSNLTQSWRNIHDAIADFEKHISFDAGNFVFHRAWGVGLIKSVADDTVTIDFARKRNHKMSLKMAVSALDTLPREHIWVLRSVIRRDKLHQKVKSDIAWALRTVIRSSGNAADMKKIKAELVPHILEPKEWSAWSTKARQILKTNKQFGNPADKLDHFVVREQPITYEEKVFNKFKAAKGFFDRVTLLYEYLDHIEKYDKSGPDSDMFREMFDFFVTYLRAPASIGEQVISSFLIVRDVVKSYPYLNPGVDLDFRPLFDQVDGVEELFASISDTGLRRKFLREIRNQLPDWPAYYVRLFPYHLSRDIIGDLERHDKTDELRRLFSDVSRNYREWREAFVWMIRNCLNDAWLQQMDVDYEKILIGMIHILDLTARDVDNRRDVTENRKLNRQVHTFLFKEGHLTSFLHEADEDSINRIYTLVSDVTELDPSLVLELKQCILDRFPDFKFYGEQEKETVSRGFIVTGTSYEEKQKLLKRIHDVEVPANSKEISEALSHGDLRENAEYKAAKERQDQLNSQAARLTEELDRAQIVRKTDVDPSTVTFGSTVTLSNLLDGTSEHYTVLGPWESNPEQGIISYLSPLGNELYNRKPNEEFQFEINETPYHYRVESIEVADF
ncbi:MAG: transcription elongation factor GreA [Spirochaetaceae bacterium]|nr:MAG: transcription elongation factor GreA [Spirochaetaceae bacterium]